MGLELGDRNAHREGFLEAVLPDQESISAWHDAGSSLS